MLTLILRIGIMLFGVSTRSLLAAVHRDNAQPEQVHLSLALQRDAMTVTWLTMESLVGGVPVVQFGLLETQLLNVVNASTTVFVDGGPLKVTRYIYKGTMTRLLPNTKYYYRVGSSNGWSHVFWFHTFPSGNDFSYRVCIFGDLGVVNGQSFGSLQDAAQRHDFDLVIHVGDIAYDLSSNDGFVGDIFMRQIEPVAAYIPYLVVTGNHEATYNYSHFVNRFSMPADSTDDNQFYSFDLGYAHFVAISTEYYGYFYDYGMQPIFIQYDWLRNDLQRANLNRAQVPWIITYMHRPMYCSNTNSYDCESFENALVRTGYLNMPGLESVFTENAVDLGFWGHEHSYERLWPVNDRHVFNLTQDPYHNAPAPIYVITGSAGCHSEKAEFDEIPKPWSAARANDYGYTIVTVKNATHVMIEQISVENGTDTVIDSLWITKSLGHRYSAQYAQTHPSIYVPGKPNSCSSRDLTCRKHLIATLKKVNEDPE